MIVRLLGLFRRDARLEPARPVDLRAEAVAVPVEEVGAEDVRVRGVVAPRRRSVRKLLVKLPVPSNVRMRRSNEPPCPPGTTISARSGLTVAPISVSADFRA